MTDAYGELMREREREREEKTSGVRGCDAATGEKAACLCPPGHAASVQESWDAMGVVAGLGWEKRG